MRLPSTIQAGEIIPDGLFGIEYSTGEKRAYRFFALEADRGTMPVTRSGAGQTSYLGKLAAYRDIFSRRTYMTHLGIPNLLILTLTNSAPRMYEIIRRLADQSGEHAAFLFKAISATDLTRPTPQLLVEPWQRAGLPSIRIDAA
jgi:hypothetical protein